MIEAVFSWLIGRFLDGLLAGLAMLARRGRYYELLIHFRTRLRIDRLFTRKFQQCSPEDKQSGMNTLAWSNVGIAKAMLEKELNRLRLRLDSVGCERLKAAQDAWQVFAENEILNRAYWCEEGTMSPTVRAAEMHQLLLDRTAEIREQIEWQDKR